MNNAIAQYPDFSPVTLEALQCIQNTLSSGKDGVSEFTFGNIYFFKDYYHYNVSRFNEQIIIFTGEKDGKRFFFIPEGIVPFSLIQELFQTCSYWKLISESCIVDNDLLFKQLHCFPEEDRDNFDYVYTRQALSTLSGKKLHKKKNHVNVFLQNYSDFSVKPLDEHTKRDALDVLERWTANRPVDEKTDYYAARSALECLHVSGITGCVLYVNQIPAAWTLAETAQNGQMVVVHFEKALTEFRGSYQYINYAFSRSLPDTVLFINREQDLGDEGLRHAKMSYKPDRFVKKYRLEQGAITQQ